MLSAHADLGERDDVQRQVQLPVPAAGQPMPGAVGAGHLDRGDTGVAGERRGGGEPAGPAGAAEQSGGDDRADAVDLGQPAAVLGERLRHLGGQLGEPGVDLAHLGDQVAGELLARRFDRPGRSHRRRGPGPRRWRSGRCRRRRGSRSRSSACSWLTSRVRCAARLARRSSSSASTVDRSSTGIGVASPASAATLAAAAASMTSFLRRPPRESSRTRAVAVAGHVLDLLAAGGQPLREVAAQATGVLHGPPPVLEPGRPARQLVDTRPAWRRSAAARPAQLAGTGVDEAGVAHSATFAPWTWRDGSEHGEASFCSLH